MFSTTRLLAGNHPASSKGYTALAVIAVWALCGCNRPAPPPAPSNTGKAPLASTDNGSGSQGETPQHQPLSDHDPKPADSSADLHGGTAVADNSLNPEELKLLMQLDVPVYPGAKLFRRPGVPDAAIVTSSGVTIAQLQCADPPAKVAAFYEDRLQQKIESPDHPGTVVKRHPNRQDSTLDNSKVITLTAVLPGGGMHKVKIQQDGAVTHIELFSIASKQAPPPGPRDIVGTGRTGTGQTASGPEDKQNKSVDDLLAPTLPLPHTGTSR